MCEFYCKNKLFIFQILFYYESYDFIRGMYHLNKTKLNRWWIKVLAHMFWLTCSVIPAVFLPSESNGGLRKPLKFFLTMSWKVSIKLYKKWQIYLFVQLNWAADWFKLPNHSFGSRIETIWCLQRHEWFRPYIKCPKERLRCHLFDWEIWDAFVDAHPTLLPHEPYEQWPALIANYPL